MNGKKVSILIHEHSAWDDTRHPFLWYLAKCWKESGIEVEVQVGIQQDISPTDLLFSHIDLSVTPPDYLEYIKCYPKVVNGGINDITKRKISANLVDANDQYSGRVIVKTNMNYGGLSENIIDSLAGKKHFYEDTIQRPWRKVNYLKPDKYPIFDSIRDVPAGVWRNPNLVVEKFMPEREGDFYCNRVAFIMGESVICGRPCSYSPVVKGANIVHSEPIDPPAGFDAIRQRYNIDYGKIDFVMHDGEIQVFDVNKTPGGLTDPDIDMRLAAKLAGGLSVFLED